MSDRIEIPKEMAKHWKKVAPIYEAALMKFFKENFPIWELYITTNLFEKDGIPVVQLTTGKYGFSAGLAVIKDPPYKPHVAMFTRIMNQDLNIVIEPSDDLNEMIEKLAVMFVSIKKARESFPKKIDVNFYKRFNQAVN